MDRRRVEVFGRAVVLTALELKLLSYFLMHAEEPITRAQLLEAVWGYSVGGTATVTVHVRRLREKIEQDPANPMLIRTVWGVGYRFSPSGP
jgi:DNA-binding response OmpR family regulator